LLTVKRGEHFKQHTQQSQSNIHVVFSSQVTQSAVNVLPH